MHTSNVTCMPFFRALPKLVPKVSRMLVQEGLQRGCSICPDTASYLLSSFLSIFLTASKLSSAAYSAECLCNIASQHALPTALQCICGCEIGDDIFKIMRAGQQDLRIYIPPEAPSSSQAHQ